MRWIRIYGSTVPFEAHVVRATLDAAGIPTQLRNDGMAGVVAIDSVVEVWIPEDARDDADELMGTRLKRDAAGQLTIVDVQTDGHLSVADDVTTGGAVSLAEPETCPACGAVWEPGFVECWQCQHALDAQPPVK